MNDEKIKVCLAIFIFCVLVAFLAIGPIFTIWSLNSLFGLKIPCSFESWAAVTWLMCALHGIKFRKKDD